MVLRQLDDTGRELWSKRYELGANEPPQLRQPCFLRGTWLGSSLVVAGWNNADAQPWVGRFAY